MNLRNEQGSVLVATLAFVLVFMLLGVASTHSVLVQNGIAEKEEASAEAFWLADAAVELAAHKLEQGTPELISPDKSCILDPSDVNYPNCGDPDNYAAIGRGYYHVYSEPVVAGSSDNWLVDAHSYVEMNDATTSAANDQFRGIQAKYGSYDIENAITTHGTVNGGCGPAGSATISGTCAAHDPFTFETVFNGMTQADFETLATNNSSMSPTFPNQNFTLDSSSDLWGIAGVTVVHVINNFNNPTFNTDNSAEYDGNPALLIVDSSGYTGNPIPTLTINGNADFCGIVWSVGEMKINGTSDVKGTVFVDGDPMEDTPFTGNADLQFNLPCIAGAIASFGGTGPPSFYAWNEYSL